MSQSSGSHSGHGHHITPIWVLLRTFFLLGLLMVLTIAAAELPHRVPSLAFIQEHSVIMNAIALTIAVLKAVLVIAIFMGVKYSTKLIKLYAIGGFVWLTLMGITLIDYYSRPWEAVVGWEPSKATALPRTSHVQE